MHIEIPAEDENPLDNYEVKLSNVEPQPFDWEALPISPLRSRKIVVESKERSEPLRDKEIIIIERGETGMTTNTALESGKYIFHQNKYLKRSKTEKKICARGGARTHDPGIKSPMLYRLSYPGLLKCCVAKRQYLRAITERL